MLTNKSDRLKRFFFARLAVSIAVFSSFYWFSSVTNQHAPHLQLLLLWLALLSLQIFTFRLRLPRALTALIQLISDFILIGFIIYNSGGYSSPFIFLLGIVIIAAGTQASIILSLTTAVLASATYIFSIYIFANAHIQSISIDQALKILFQTSLFFLVGGIMALISRRHATLEQKQKDTSTQHKQLQEVHSQVLQAMQEGIVTLNSDLSIQAFNPAASYFLGLSEQHAGFKIDSFIHIPDDLYKQPRYEVSLHDNDLLLTFTKLQHNKQSSWLMTIVNITETRNLERQLAEQDKLASIGQMAAMLAHEIRNPMQTIAQATELMGLHHQDKALEKIITSEIHRLNRLVSDMLDYANPLHPRAKPLHIKSFIKETLQQIDLNQTHDIQTNVEDTTLVLDPDHLRLVLDNLLRNAIRVSPEPTSISVTLAIVDDTWILQVKDQGSGIEEHMKGTLFQPFQTGHKQGTGLGLATVWQVCQANEWQVNIDEALTTGACFIVKGAVQPTRDKGEEEHG